MALLIQAPARELASKHTTSRSTSRQQLNSSSILHLKPKIHRYQQTQILLKMCRLHTRQNHARHNSNSLNIRRLSLINRLNISLDNKARVLAGVDHKSGAGAVEAVVAATHVGALPISNTEETTISSAETTGATTKKAMDSLLSEQLKPLSPEA